MPRHSGAAIKYDIETTDIYIAGINVKENAFPLLFKYTVMLHSAIIARV